MAGKIKILANLGDTYIFTKVVFNIQQEAELGKEGR